MSESKNIEEIIIRYLNKEIDTDELHILEAWIDESKDNNDLFFEMKNLFDLKEYPLYVQNTDVANSWNNLSNKLDTETKVIESSKRSVWSHLLKYAAIFISAVVIGWQINNLSKANSDNETLTYNEINIERGNKASTIILSDGSKVILNAATKFKYPTQFNSKERKVYLEGEAFFDIAKNKDKPFIVSINKQNITVLGTIFNVEAYENESNSIITLLSGKIKLEAYDDIGNLTNQTFVFANQKVVSDNKTGIITLTSINEDLSSNWTKGEYKFKDEYLSKITKRLEKYYDVNFILKDKELYKIKYTGTFSTDQDINEVLRIINHKKQFNYTKKGKNITIEKTNMSN